MKNLKLSPWHDGSVKPKHLGVYEVYCKCCNQNFFSNWTGKHFSTCEFEKHLARKRTDEDYKLKLDKWRGVLK